MTKKDSETYGNNIKYLIDCVSPAFTLSKYVPKQTFYNLNISLSTLKKALYGENLSVKTARQIAEQLLPLFIRFNKKQNYSGRSVFAAERLQRQVSERMLYPNIHFPSFRQYCLIHQSAFSLLLHGISLGLPCIRQDISNYLKSKVSTMRA